MRVESWGGRNRTVNSPYLYFTRGFKSWFVPLTVTNVSLSISHIKFGFSKPQSPIANPEVRAILSLPPLKIGLKIITRSRCRSHSFPRPTPTVCRRPIRRGVRPKTPDGAARRKGGKRSCPPCPPAISLDTTDGPHFKNKLSRSSSHPHRENERNFYHHQSYRDYGERVLVSIPELTVS